MFKRCTICNRPAAVMGVYAPKDQAAVCAPRGKQRNIVYALCNQCFARPEVSEKKIEAMVEAEFAHTRN